MSISPINHSNKRRANHHNYSWPGFYLVTLVSRDRRPLFGSLVDKPPISPEISLSPLGIRLAQKEAKVISQVYPMVDVRHFTVMPDHLHIILHVKDKLQEGRHLGMLVNGFKSGCRHAFKDIYGYSDTIFEENYNDRILYNYNQLKSWFKYLDDNPRRMAIKRRIPQLFKVSRNIPVNGCNCDVVGNMFLLDIPDKMCVIVHRADSDADFAKKKADWLNFGEGGGVLVSAAISPREKQVMREALDRGYSMIVVRNEGMSKFYKPSGEAFDACANGQLLQITPFPDNFSSKTITRPECLYLNDFAAKIAVERQPASISAFINN